MIDKVQVQNSIDALRQQCTVLEPAVQAMKENSPKVAVCSLGIAKHLPNAIDELGKAADELQKQLDAL